MSDLAPTDSPSSDAPTAPADALVAAPPAEASVAPVVAPTAPAEPPRRSPEEWAEEKGTDDWLLAAARARHLTQPHHEHRSGWLPNGQLTEQAFDACIDSTLNGSLR